MSQDTIRSPLIVASRRRSVASTASCLKVSVECSDIVDLPINDVDPERFRSSVRSLTDKLKALGISTPAYLDAGYKLCWLCWFVWLQKPGTPCLATGGSVVESTITPTVRSTMSLLRACTVATSAWRSPLPLALC